MRILQRSKSKIQDKLPNKPGNSDSQPYKQTKTTTRPTEIKEFNITIPITSSRILVEIAKLLREEYYFEHIPLDWINIPIRPNEIHEIKTNKKPMIPTSLVQLQEALENTTDEIYINVPIKQQKEINPTITILQQHFEIPQIPNYILDL